MAKQLVNPIERHVEKAVVGITLLCLIGVIAKYLVTTPNQLEFGGETVSPRTADEKVYQHAADVRQAVRAAQPSSEKPPDPPVFDPSLKLAELPAAVSWLPAVPIVDPPTIFTGDAGLVEVAPLPKPLCRRGRSTIELPESMAANSPTGKNAPVEWITVSSLFNRKEQSDRQAREYGGTRKDVVFARIEAERRARRPDGTWSDSDWKPIVPFPAAEAPSPPPISLVEQDGKTTIRMDDHKAVTKFRDDLADSKLQLEILRPLMRKVINGDCWSFPLITDEQGKVLIKERDVLLQDDEYFNPESLPSSKPQNRYPCLKEAGATTLLPPAKRLEEAQLMYNSAKNTCTLGQAQEAASLAGELIDAADASGADKAKAKRLKDDAENLARSIKDKICTPASGSKGLEGGKPVRERLPQQQVWVIDGLPGSLENGKTYQYRLRAVIYNARAGEPDHFRNRYDAAVILIQGSWSAPSDPVTLGDVTRFFVTGANPHNGEVNVEIFQWFRGEWLKPSKPRLPFKLGERIAAKEEKTRAPDPDDPKKSYPASINYDARAKVMDVEFDRPCRERKAVGKGGVKFVPGRACSVLVLTDDGVLQERFDSVDKNHPDKKMLGDIAYKPPKPEP